MTERKSSVPFRKAIKAKHSDENVPLLDQVDMLYERKILKRNLKQALTNPFNHIYPSRNLKRYIHTPIHTPKRSFFKDFKKSIKQVKERVKQYGSLWFIFYFGTFVPLFMFFSIPYHLGYDIIGPANFLERHGWLDWLKWFNINPRSLIDRCENNDTFVIFDSIMDGKLRYEFGGQTATMLLTTFIVWELMKPFRYIFYAALCRYTVQFCQRRNILPKFFKKF